MADRIDDPLTGDESRLGGADRAATARAADSGDPAVIRAGIRDTRERVGDTLEQIGERLNPHHIAEQVKENVRDATIGRVENMARSAAGRVNVTRSTLMDTVRENPIPAALVGIGLGWLFLNRQSSPEAKLRSGHFGGSSQFGDSRAGYAGSPYGSEYGGTQESAYSSGSSSEFAGGYSSGYTGGFRSASSGEGAVEQARERVGEIGQHAKETASQVAERAQHAASTVAEQTRRQTRRVESQFYESPLAVGAATLALGIAAGLALPATEKEVQLMGDARDRLVDRASEAAGETKEKVQRVAERVIDEGRGTVTEAAREEGLTSR